MQIHHYLKIINKKMMMHIKESFWFQPKYKRPRIRRIRISIDNQTIDCI